VPAQAQRSIVYPRETIGFGKDLTIRLHAALVLRRYP
jgi:hypothetical protein